MKYTVVTSQYIFKRLRKHVEKDFYKQLYEICLSRIVTYFLHAFVYFIAHNMLLLTHTVYGYFILDITLNVVTETVT